jgi:hypothetical protein
VSSGNGRRRILGKGKSRRYVVLDLGDRVSADILLNESPSGLVLELQRDNPHKFCSVVPNHCANGGFVKG